MPISWTGLGSGIERGIRIGATLDEIKNNKADRAFERDYQTRTLNMAEEANRRAAESHSVNQKVLRLQADLAEDEILNTKVRRVSGSAQLMAAQASADPAGYLKQMQAHPEMAAQAQQTVKEFFDLRALYNAADGNPRTFTGVSDEGPGRWSVNVDVTRPDGGLYPAKLTQNGSADPNDPVEIWDAERLGQEASWLKGLAEQMRVGAGDTAPLTALEKQAATKSERAWERQKIKLEGRQDRMTARAKAGITGGGQIRQFGGDAESIIDDHFGGKFENGLVSFGDDETSGKALTAKSAAQRLMGLVPQDQLGSIGAANFAKIGIEIAEAEPSQAQLDEIEAEIKAMTPNTWGRDEFKGPNGETAEGYRQRRTAAESQQARAAALERALEQIEQQFAKPGVPAGKGRGGAKSKPGLPVGGVQANASAPPGMWRVPPDGEPVTDGPLAGQSIIPDGRGGYMAMGRDWKSGDTSAQNAVPQPQSQSEYEALPSGARFMDPNGQVRVRP